MTYYALNWMLFERNCNESKTFSISVAEVKQNTHELAYQALNNWSTLFIPGPQLQMHFPKYVIWWKYYQVLFLRVQLYVSHYL